MIDLELVEENKPVELKLVENSKGGTNNYNELENKPTINGKTLQGNLTLEDLGIIVNAVKDILINGKTIVDKDGNANIPIASDKDLGVMKVNRNGGVAVVNATLTLVKATTNNIENRGSSLSPIVPSNYDYAVKCAMTDGKGAEWSATEKVMARNRLGLDVWEEVVDITITEEVMQVILEFENPYREIYAYISQDGVTEVDTGNKYIYPLLQNDTKTLTLRHYTGAKLTTSLPDLILRAVNHNDTFIECSNATSNKQSNSTTYDLYTKCFDRALCDKIKDYETLNFYGLFCNVCKIGTRIRIMGVRA